ncbi:hypothetical protein [Candidatus Nitrospira neomarina]|uniref:DUF5666 domain-containing protein n=1 Tax=Candidatus Nitrospira neomarina TaxID=3020899 RepID=A0AA96K0D7_9BACT|nr:hypothetical protein [Candidatus Nitrospira neomarina]WNM61966.1 hypothetical protein PQG83_19835 [Candidatus Nitrospira neomarina]
MKYFSILAALCSLFLTIPAWAHGDAPHVMGTVTELGNDHVVVTTPKGESLTLAFHPQITFQQNGIHVENARPQVGDRLVAEVSKKGVPENRDWVATEITFSTPKKKP